MYTLPLLILLLLFAPETLAQDQIPHLYKKSSEKAENWPGKRPSDVNITSIQFDRSVLSAIEKKELQQISIPGPDDQLFIARIQQIIHSKNSGWSAVGFIDDDRLNSFIFSYSPSTKKALSSINILSDHTYLELRYDSSQNHHILVEKDPHQSDELPCGHNDQFVIQNNSQSQKNSQWPLPAHDHETSVIDVMVVYTPNAENWAESNSSGIDNTVNQSMAVAQMAADNSELDIQFRLVHSQRINYSETGNSALDLQRLTASPSFNLWGQKAAGYMDEVHQLRSQYGADLVAMFTETNDTGGVAWVITSESGLPHYAFSLTRIQQAAGRTHVHEMGHNFGNAHSRNQSQNPANETNTGIFPYSTGWRWAGNDGLSYASVMTYLEGSNQALIFSNPAINHLGIPTGSYEGEFAPADNARSMREIQHVVEEYRMPPETFDVPTVVTDPVTDISYSLAQLNGNATQDGGSNIIERGFCWDIEPNPNFSDECIRTGSGSGLFQTQLTGLHQDTQYYVRAFATNSAGSSFGDEQMFTTLAFPAPAAFEPTGIDAVSFTARWSGIQDAERYFLDVSTNPDFPFYITGYRNRNVGDATSFAVTNLMPGSDYYYRVRSGVETTQSNNSNVEEVSTVDVSTENSEVELSRDKVLATGIQESIIRVFVQNSDGEPVGGMEMRIEQDEGSSAISPGQAVTDSDGLATFAITNTSEETVQYNVFAAGLNLSKIEIEFLFSEGELTLGNNYPNPYNRQTTIPIVVPQSSRVRLDVYNSLGSRVQTIVDEEFNVGYYEIPFNASGLASGVYFYRMVTNQGVRIEKMLLAK